MGFKVQLELTAQFAIKLMWVCLIVGPTTWIVVPLVNWVGMSKSDVAAWVQAVGSISAICSAIWIARRDSRLRAESEIKNKIDAAERSIVVAEDARKRVLAAINGARKLGVTAEFVDAISADLELSQQHIKDVLSIQGMDSSIFTQLFVIRISVERLPDSLMVLASGDNYYEELLSEIGCAIDKLRCAKESFGPIPAFF